MKFAVLLTMIIGFSNSASARFLDQMSGTPTRTIVKVDPNNIGTFSKLVVHCFSQSGKGMQETPADCHALIRSGSKMTPNQFATIRQNLEKHANGAKDLSKKQVLKDAIVQLARMETHYARKAAANKTARHATKPS